jgi:hypothetical protein
MPYRKTINSTPFLLPGSGSNQNPMNRGSPFENSVPALHSTRFRSDVHDRLVGIRSGSGSEMEFVWNDEFDGKALDYSKWEAEVNAFGGGNQELQLYTDQKENLRIEGGHLVLEARKDKPDISGTVREYSSGRIRSKYRGDWMYGKFEIRAKLPGGQGVWPAIWMLPTENVYGTWAASGEIDIIEFK